MTDFLRIDDQHSDLLMPGGFLAPAEESLRDALARAEEARADERSKRLAAEETADQMATLIAQEHLQLAAERTARERAEAALAKAQRTASEMATVVAHAQQRADDAEERARQAFCAYLDDPFRAPQGRPSRIARLRGALRRS